MERNNAITYTKAIGILLVTLGHAMFSDTALFVRIVVLFHVPLFFFFSGYCFKEKYLSDFRLFTKRRIKGLYIPFVKWNILFILLHNVFFRLNIYNGEYGFRGYCSKIYDGNDIFRQLIATVTNMSGEEQLLGAFWFLKPMLFSAIISYMLLRIFNKPFFQHAKISKEALSLMTAFIITIVFSYLKIFIPYFNIGAQAFYCSCFFLAGTWANKHNLKTYNGGEYLMVVIACVIGINLPSMSLNQPVFSLYMLIPYWLIAIILTWAVYSCCCHIKRCKLLEYIGNHTMIIFTLQFLAFKVVSLIIIWIYNLPIERLAEFLNIEEYAQTPWCYAYFFSGVTIPLLCNYIYELTMLKSKAFINALK